MGVGGMLNKAELVGHWDSGPHCGYPILALSI